MTPVQTPNGPDSRSTPGVPDQTSGPRGQGMYLLLSCGSLVQVIIAVPANTLQGRFRPSHSTQRTQPRLPIRGS